MNGAYSCIVQAGYEDTYRTIIYTGRPMRVIRNPIADDWEEVTPLSVVLWLSFNVLQNRQADIKSLTQNGIIPIEQTMKEVEAGTSKYNNKDLFMGSPLLCGAAAGAIDEILPAATIINQMVDGENCNCCLIY